MSDHRGSSEQGRLSAQSRRLIAVHTIEGRYIYFHQRAFERAEVDISQLWNRRWQEFAANGIQIEIERQAIDQAVASDEYVHLNGVRRHWGKRVFVLNNRISTIRSRRGTRLILREAVVVDERAIADDGVDAVPAGRIPPRDDLVPPVPPAAQPADALDRVAGYLLAARSLLTIEEQAALLKLVDTALYVVNRKLESPGDDGATSSFARTR